MFQTQTELDTGKNNERQPHDQSVRERAGDFAYRLSGFSPLDFTTRDVDFDLTSPTPPSLSSTAITRLCCHGDG